MFLLNKFLIIIGVVVLFKPFVRGGGLAATALYAIIIGRFMSIRKEIPLIETEIKNLIGTCNINGTAHSVTGDLFLKEGRPFLKELLTLYTS